MLGAIAAGHPLTAEAGARVLAEGGNAVDACVAAGFASWVCESPLTGPGGGGFILVHRAKDRSTRVLDFFVSVPGLGLETGAAGAMEAVTVDFSGDSTQVFKIGAASCAVPGAAMGLETAHASFGKLPWKELIAPAIELARSGVEITRPQAYLHAILDLILRHSPEGRRVYGGQSRLVAGDRLVMSDLAGTLERLAAVGSTDLHTGELAHALVEHVHEGHGAITLRDLAEYRVVRRRPVRATYRAHELASNSPPSSGGILIAHALRLLDRLPDEPAGSAAAIAQLAAVMREQGRARSDSFERRLYRGGAERVLEARLDAALARILAGEPGRPERATPGGTTHISVVDGEGNAAAMTISTGSGSGVVVPGTGINLNNMLGEFDLPQPPAPGRRLSSMMSPSVVFGDGGVRLVLGSAGSLRLRSAVLQVIVNVVGHGLRVDEALRRPRVHVEEPYLHCEGGHDADEVDRLVKLGWEVVRWRRPNLYFGGVGAVEVLSDGSLAAAGDPRRGGHGIVVE
jgi:gamma-glutamyltranspeptidase/glutathione hydrolase